MKTLLRPHAAVLLGLAFGISAMQGEVLDTIGEYGNAASANATSGADIARGFTNPAADEYTITAGGTDIWGNSDNGSFIYDADTTQSGNFSAVVRSVAVGAPAGETLAAQWGRSGVMARTNPTEANSANVAHTRKSGTTTNGFTTLQYRDTAGGGTGRVGGEHGNQAANLANGSVANTPLWMALHRYDGVWYTSWADDVGGAPGTWSDTRQHNATAQTNGDVFVGLCHQSHNINPIVNTAEFDNFSVGPFDSDLGDFPRLYDCDVTFNGLDVILSASGTEVGAPSPSDVEWAVNFFAENEVVIQGELRADIYLQNNAGNRAAFDAMTAGTPDGSTTIETIRWAGNNYVETNAAGENRFAMAVPGQFGANQESYAVNLTGEIHIPSDADREDVDFIRFHDGVDDYVLLVIDGVELINNNTWSNLAGTGNNGGTQATLDVSDPKFDDGEWVSFQMGMWEGGGGDDCVLQWDALDITGADTVTGGTDSVADSYNPTDLPDGLQVSFAHDRSDEIPSANFRHTRPALVADEDGMGQPNMLTLTTQIPSDAVFLQVVIDGATLKTISLLPEIATADFIARDVVELTLEDLGGGGTSDVNETNLTVLRNGDDISGSVVISKTGTTTTITDTFASDPDPFTNFTYIVSGNTTVATGNKAFSETAVATSYAINAELRAGLDPAPNATVGWDVMEFDGFAYTGAVLPGNEASYRLAQEIIREAPILAEGAQPYINHRDPDDAGAFGGEWPNDLPILSDIVGTGNDNYITFARTVITIGAGEEGDYTFRIRGDDGHGFRISGATAVSTGGSANNRIDARDDSFFHPANGGNSNAFHVFNFPSAGDYPVEFFAFEGNGGSYQEISWAQGAFTSVNATTSWQLVGDTSAYVATSAWPEIDPAVIPALPTGGGDEGWAAKVWYGATVGTLDATLTFINSTPPDPAFDGFLPELNHSDDAGNAGQFNPTAAFPNDPIPAGGTDNIAMLAHGRLVAPVDGDYTIQMRCDDGVLLRFVNPATQFSSLSGGGVLHPSATNEVYFAAGTGDTNMRASVYLTQGEHDVLFAWWEGGGGSHFEISSAPGIVPAHGSAYELITTTPSTDNLYLGIATLAAFGITAVSFDQGNDEFTLSWDAEEGVSYGLYFSSDGVDWGADVNDSILADPLSADPLVDFSGGTLTYGPFPNPGGSVLLFRAQRD